MFLKIRPDKDINKRRNQNKIRCGIADLKAKYKISCNTTHIMISILREVPVV
jgi:hypothetical protein